MTTADQGPSEPVTEEKTSGDVRLRYRLLTGIDNREFCERISAALAEGYILAGSPAIAFDGKNTVVAQAVRLPD